MHLVAFFLEDQRYALPLHSVERVVSAVEISPLPKAPEIVLGLINMRGKIVPVLDMRRRFHLPEREPRLQDHFIVARTSNRTVVLPVDSVGGVIEIFDQEVTEATKILPSLEYIQGVVKLGEGMLLIHDLERFLSLEEENNLYEALRDKRVKRGDGETGMGEE
ncbi:MAG: purine-binding chemotaxis protein CheW [Candidatus Tectomicrobia bacterium]|uniref:Purine-binding chemotaxis protein CheW n=1 Tax=Tectimicrobiota bacterium TaxID=2528274 RepID=A0A933LQ26_UNCTE|nr:purine-binding chemotaxis protein CheW [Candidatus Tectomicrobia bacterium]